MELAYGNKDNKRMNKAKVITVTSGKGGVGKSSTATNLALSLSALDNKVCIFDADASLANINILLGIQPKFTLQHLLNGEKTLSDITIKGPRGLNIIPGATGIAEYAHLSAQQKSILLTALDRLQQQYDYLIIDTAAGIGDDVLDFVKASQFSIIIITPEPTSLTDSFSLLKVLKRENYQQRAHVLVNMAMDYRSGQSIYKRFEAAVTKYINADISYLGYVQADETMISSVSLQCPAVLLNPDAEASKCFETIAKSIESRFKEQQTTSFSDFWRQLNPAQAPLLNESKTSKHTLSDDGSNTEQAQEMDFSQATAFCLNQLSNNEISEQQRAEFLKAIEVHLELGQQVDTTGSATRDLYQHLEQNNFPKGEIRELINTLEQVYQQRYSNSLYSAESASLRLLAQFNAEQDALRYIHAQIASSFKRQFSSEIVPFSEQLDVFIEANELSQTSFDNVLAKLLSAYQQKFSSHYPTQADKDLASAKQSIDALKQQQQKLNLQLKKTEQLLAEKTAVLDKIQQLLPSTALVTAELNG
ncbi:MAG: MinD/ParA family protein [Cycloclasticus sp.]